MRKLYYTAGDIQNPWRSADGSHKMRFAVKCDNRSLTVAAQKRCAYFRLAVLILPVAAVAQPNPQDAVRQAMTASVDKQRASIAIQVNSVLGRTAAPLGSFFTAPWVEAAAALPACEPMAKPELDQLIELNSKTQGVKPELIQAVISQESGNRPCALSAKGAQGLMQLMPATATQFGVSDPFDPKQNVEAGTKLLKELLAKYGGDVSLTLSAYNAGSGRVDRDGGVPQIPETMRYVTEIMGKLPKP